MCTTTPGHLFYLPFWIFLPWTLNLLVAAAEGSVYGAHCEFWTPPCFLLLCRKESDSCARGLHSSRKVAQQGPVRGLNGSFVAKLYSLSSVFGTHIVEGEILPPHVTSDLSSYAMAPVCPLQVISKYKDFFKKTKKVVAHPVLRPFHSSSCVRWATLVSLWLLGFSLETHLLVQMH